MRDIFQDLKIKIFSKKISKYLSKSQIKIFNNKTKNIKTKQIKYDPELMIILEVN